MDESAKEVARVNQCLVQLRNLIRDKKDLKCPEGKVGDEFLARFIRARKFDAAAALKTLKAYYDIRRDNAKLFERCHPLALKSVYETKWQMVLKNRDPQGRIVIVCSISFWDPTKVNLDELFISFTLVLEEIIRSVAVQRDGLIFVTDMAGASFGHIRQLTVSQVRRFISMFQGAFPARFKGLYVLNEPYTVHILHSICKPFRSKKLDERIRFFGNNYSSFHEVLPKNILPVSFGGNLSDEEAEDTALMKELFKRDNYYKGMLKYGYKNKK